MNRRSERMTIWGHLEELRGRLLKAVLALAAATIGSLFLSEKAINLLAQAAGGMDKLQAIEVTENIAVFMRVALLSGVLLAMPVILYQLLRFVLPGLKPNEKRWLYGVIFFGTLLFAAGVAFAYFVMLPASVKFLLEFLAVETKPRISNYINFVTNLLFWMGVAFQTPLIIFALARFDLVSAKTLARRWREGLVVIAILAAVITPTVDPVNMALLMVPLLGLYWLSVLLAFLARRKAGPDQQKKKK
jgi:sec-independent protein translocase protein TatC